MGTHAYNSGTDASTGANNITFWYDKAGIEAATEKNIYAQFADKKSMPLKMGKEFKISKWAHILDDSNVSGLGTDGSGNPLGGSAAYRVTTTNAGGNTIDNEVYTVEATADARVAEINAANTITGYTAVKTVIAAGNNNGNLYGSSRDYGNISNNLPSLAEGAGKVNAVGVTKITLSTGFARYGNLIEYTDEIEMFSEDAVQVQFRQELGYLASKVSDDLIQRDLLNGTNTMYTGAATKMSELGAEANVVGDGSDDVDSVVSYDLIRKADKVLTKNKAMKHNSIITGSTKIDTKTINKAWSAIIGADVKYQLESMTDTFGNPAWVPVRQYASAGNIMEDEVGAIHDTRFVHSDRAMEFQGQGAQVKTDGGGTVTYTGNLKTTTYATKAAADSARGVANTGADTADSAQTYFDVHPILFPTKGAYATVGLKGHGKIKFNTISPDHEALDNAYQNQGLFSYNFWHAGIILQQERLLKILTPVYV